MSIPPVMMTLLELMTMKGANLGPYPMNRSVDESKSRCSQHDSVCVPAAHAIERDKSPRRPSFGWPREPGGIQPLRPFILPPKQFQRPVGRDSCPAPPFEQTISARLSDVDVAYDRIGRGYSNFRSTDPDIAAAIRAALGPRSR
jgi:hypothetical protein